MTKKILITGGAGYIWKSHSTGTLNEGYEVVVYDNLCNSSKESLKRVEELSGKHITFMRDDDENCIEGNDGKRGCRCGDSLCSIEGSRRICIEAIRVLP